MAPSTFPNLKTDTGLPAHRKPPVQPSGQPSVLEENDNYNPPKIDINRQPPFGERPSDRRPTERPTIDRQPFDRKPGAPELDRPDLSTPDLDTPDLSRPDLSKPDVGRPDLGRPDLGRPDVGRPEIGRPDLDRPDVNRPDSRRPAGRPITGRPDVSTRPDLSRHGLDDKMISRPVDAVQPPKAENNVNIGQSDIRRPPVGPPDATGPIVEEPHREEDQPPVLSGDDIGRIKPQPGFGDRRTEYTRPSVDGKQPPGDGKYLPADGKPQPAGQPPGQPAVDHGDDIYNPPEYKAKPDGGLPDDGRYKTEPAQMQPPNEQFTPEYKHPLTPTDYGDRYPPTSPHKKPPTINDRKPPTDFNPELPVDNRRPVRPNISIADEYPPDSRYPDAGYPDSRQPPTRPDLLHPHIKTDTPFVDNRQPPFKGECCFSLNFF